MLKKIDCNILSEIILPINENSYDFVDTEIITNLLVKFECMKILKALF